MSAHVLVELDTTPPIVSVVGSGTVTPPDEVNFTVTSSEEIGWLDLTFTDATGERHDVGSRRLTDSSVFVTIPSVLVPRGSATFRATVADTVSNVAVVSKTVNVVGTRPFDVVLDLVHGLDVDQGLYHGYIVEVSVSKTGVLASPVLVRAIEDSITGTADAPTAVVIPGSP